MLSIRRTVPRSLAGKLAATASSVACLAASVTGERLPASTNCRQWATAVQWTCSRRAILQSQMLLTQTMLAAGPSTVTAFCRSARCQQRRQQVGRLFGPTVHTQLPHVTAQAFLCFDAQDQSSVLPFHPSTTLSPPSPTPCRPHLNIIHDPARLYNLLGHQVPQVAGVGLGSTRDSLLCPLQRLVDTGGLGARIS